MQIPLLCLVTAVLATWGVLRRRRIFATADGAGSWATTSSRPQARLADLGFNPLGQRLAAFNAVVFAIDVALFATRGLSVDWPTAWLGATLLGGLLLAWLNFYFVPGGPGERFVAEVLFVVFLMVLLTNVASPMQYGAVAIGAPYADPWLAAADARIGVYVPAMAAWTRAHRGISLAATVAYSTLLPQFLFAVVVLSALRERERLWEFAFHFHVCLILTVAALMIWPAICPPAYYGFAPTIDMTRLIGQIKGFHDGTRTLVRFNELEGLVSFPSFHVAGGLIVTWAFRRRPWILVPLIGLNAAMVASTFITGVHYVVDVVATVPLCGVSLAAYRVWGQSLLSDANPGTGV